MNKFDQELADLLVSWFKRVAELHQYAVDLTKQGNEIIASGDYSRVLELVQNLDGVTDTILQVGDVYGLKATEIISRKHADDTGQELDFPDFDFAERNSSHDNDFGLDTSIPSIVKKEKLIN
jgi:hypothetical protein